MRERTGNAKARSEQTSEESAAFPAQPPLDPEPIVALLSSSGWLTLAESNPPAFRDALRLVARRVRVPGDGTHAAVEWVWQE